MISTLFKISIRNILKHKNYSLTNIVGLTIGFTAFILIAAFIRFELNWDKHNQNYNRIYRIQRYYTKALYAMNGNNISPHSRAITALLLEKQFPEFEKVSVIREIGDKFLSSGFDHQIFDNEGIHADENFFQLFTYHFIEGNQSNALTEPFSVVISQSVAEKLFGKKAALGQAVIFEKKYQYKVTGVYTDLPGNSSLRPNYIVSFNTLISTDSIGRNDMWAGDCMTYAMLKPNTDVKLLGDKIKHLFSGYKSTAFEELQLCPLSMIYLNFNGSNDYLIVLKLFGLIAFFILLMSVFNYINLSVAKSSLRTKEIAIKKVIGSKRKLLLLQFLGETFVLSFVSLILAFILAIAFLPVFSNIVDKSMNFDLLNNWKFMVFMLLIMIIVGLLSGIYPALFMSSKKITALLKGELFGKRHNMLNIKKILVTFQFGISIFLIFLTLSITLQIKYLTNRDLGFSKDGIIYTNMTVSQNGITFDRLRNQILQHTEIKEASMSQNLPFVRYGGGTTNWEGNDPEEKINCRFNYISYDYLKNLGTTIIAGRDFSRDFQGDVGKCCIINETAAKCFGWENPIGKRLNNNKLTIVGVVKNFIYKDLHNEIEPSVMILAPKETKGNWIFAFRIEKDKMAMAKTALVQEFEKAFPNDPFEFRDLSSTFNNEKSFKTYHSVNYTILFFTVLNIVLAILGLLGLVSFTVARRKKEIGIRKINGSTSKQIFYLLSWEYFVLLFFALIGGIPLAWWVYESIPGANKLPVQPWILAVGSLILFIIVILTTGYQSFRAATRNPVEALRYE